MTAGPAVDASGLVVLTALECRRLLEPGGIGRLAVPTDDAPAMRPVNFALEDDQIVIRTGDGTVWEAAQRQIQASFEIDEVCNEDHTAWSVLVSGELSRIDHDRVEVPVRSWTEAPKEQTVVLSMKEVSGRRIADARRPGTVPKDAVRRHAATLAPTSNDPDGTNHWGRSEQARALTRRVVEPAYRSWFRVKWQGLEHLPRTGAALLVANHAGAIPIDATLLMHGLEKHLRRPVYALHHHGLRAVPVVGTVLARNGGVVAHPYNALRLFREGQLVLVFPEGTKGTTKPYSQRYQLARFGRGGFVDVALRAGVPIVPIAVMGSEETMPTLFQVPTGGDVGWPVTLNSLLLGPLGAIVHFPAAITARVLDPIRVDEPPHMDDYPSYLVADVTETVRTQIQTALNDMRSSRRPWRR